VHDRRPAGGPQQQVPVLVLLPVVEEELAEAGALDALEELLGDDLVCVDVVAGAVVAAEVVAAGSSSSREMK